MAAREGQAKDSKSGPFRALQQPRAFEAIIIQIEQAIMDGELRPGDRLPSERELVETFQVSRPSVREALRVLEMFGVVVARRGAGADAGSVVASGAQSGLENVLRLHCALQRVPTADLVEVRIALESCAAMRAAEGRPDVSELRTILERMASVETPDDFYELDSDFHLGLAQISENKLMPMLMEAFRDSIAREMRRGFNAIPDWEEERDRLVAEHRQILDAIEQGQGAEASAAISRHIEAFYGRAVEPGASASAR